MTAAIEFRDVTKTFRKYHEKNQSLKAFLLKRKRGRFEEFRALHDITLDIETGETFAFIGHNGAGKSTILKIIAGILEPDSGSIMVQGRVSALLELGAGFHPELSGRENVFLNAALLGLGRKMIQQRFDEIVEFAGVADFIDSPVKHYSSGMFARLGFAVAVNVDPDILLIDEVFAVGDEEFQRKCAEKIYDFRRSGRTVVLVSHGLGTIRNLCDRVALLNHGAIESLGAPGAVVDQYLSDVATGASGGTPPVATGAPLEGQPSRWGSGEVRIERVQLLTAGELRTGDEVVIRLHWQAHTSIIAPVFAVGIYRADGVHIFGTNTHIAQFPIAAANGSGYVDFELPRLPLLAGAYSLTVAVHDESVGKMFDEWHGAVHFSVQPGLDSGAQGIVALGGTWRIGE